MGSVPEKMMTLVRKPLLFIAPAAVLVVLLALATNVLPLRQIIAQRQELAATQARLDELTAANDALAVHVDALRTPVEVERIAREELGYIRPGEQPFVVIDPSDQTGGFDVAAQSVGDGVTPDRAAEAPVRRANLLSKLWDFLTGRDLAGSR
jgi:cell division protein FtsB